VFHVVLLCNVCGHVVSLSPKFSHLEIRVRRLLKTKLVLFGILVVVIVVVAGVLLMSGHSGVSTNEKIQIPSGGIVVNTVADPAAGTGMVTWTTATLTVDNIGSVPVTISKIYVQGAAYSYSSTAASGTFSAASNQIQPGQSLTFTITDPSPTPLTLANENAWNFKAVTSNGTEASTAYSWG